MQQGKFLDALVPSETLYTVAFGIKSAFVSFVVCSAGSVSTVIECRTVLQATMDSLS